jgi:hypothetical protein
VLRAALDLGLDLPRPELAIDGVDHEVAEGRPLALGLADQVADLLESLGVQRLEREVLQLPLDLEDAKPVRQRRVDLEGLGGLLLLLGS